MAPKQKTTLKFSCKVCSYTDSSQEKIAVHFLKTHMDVDFCTLSHPIADTKAGPRKGIGEHSALNKKDAVQEKLSAETMNSRVRNRKSRRNKPDVKTDVVHHGNDGMSSDTTTDVDTSIATMSDKEDKSTAAVESKGRRGRKRKNEDKVIKEPEHELGRGKRRKSTPKRYVTGNELQNKKRLEKPNGVPEVDHDFQNTATTSRLRNAKKGDGLPSIESVCGEVTPHPTPETIEDKNSRSEDSQNERNKIPHSRNESNVSDQGAWSDDVSNMQPKTKKNRTKALKGNEDTRETLNQKIKRLPISQTQLQNKLDKLTKEWDALQEQRREESFRKCSFTNCDLKLIEGDMQVHETCHAKSMDGLKCPHCDFMCLHWRHMRKHLRIKHDLSLGKVFVCDCTQRFKRAHQLRRHVMYQHVREQLVDGIIGGLFKLEEFKLEEISIRKEAKPSTIQPQSDSDTTKKSDRPRKKRKKKFDEAEIEESDEDVQRNKVTFECELCSSKFRNEDAVLSHKGKHATKEESIFACAECDCPFAGSEGPLKDHYRQHHTSKLRRYQCQECTYSTDKFNQISSHEGIHSGEKGVRCDQCGKLLANQYNLRVHKFRKHCSEDEKNVACSACSYRCADISILRDHIKQHHKAMLPNPVYHRCPECDYVGNKRKNLEFHMRVHTEQRRFKCHMCPYASKTKNHLKIHLQTHNGYHTSICPQCPFKAASKKRLSEHIMRQHLHVEPYLCKVCKWRTAYSGNMWKHINQHKKELGEMTPTDPVVVELELLQDVELPEMPKAPTGKTRGQPIGDPKSELALNVQGLAVEDSGTTITELQVLEIPNTNVGIQQGEGGEIQIVHIQQDDSLAAQPIGGQVMAHIQQNGVELLNQNNADKVSHMEIFISHDGEETPDGTKKAVEVLQVNEYGNIVTSTMNPDVEVAVLALAQLEPGSHATQLQSHAAGNGGRITILQTVQQNPESGQVPDQLHDAAVSAAIEAGIHVEASAEDLPAVEQTAVAPLKELETADSKSRDDVSRDGLNKEATNTQRGEAT